MDDEYPMTADSIAAAKAAQQRERDAVMRQCAVVFDEDGKLFWTRDQIEELPHD